MNINLCMGKNTIEYRESGGIFENSVILNFGDTAELYDTHVNSCFY